MVTVSFGAVPTGVLQKRRRTSDTATKTFI